MHDKNNCYRIFFLFVYIFTVFFFASTQSLLPSSEEVQQTRSIFAQAGLVFPVHSYPISKNDLSTELSNLAVEIGSEQEDVSIKAIKLSEELAQSDEGFTLDIHAQVSYDYRLRTDEVLLENGIYKDGIDFYRSYLSIPPLVRLDLGLGAPRGFSIEATGELRREWKEDWFNPDNLYGAASPSNPVAFDNNIMPRGVLYWRGDNAFFSIGRDKVQYGPPLEGTLYPSERLPYWDSFRAEIKMGDLTMDWFVSTIQARTTKNGIPDVAPGTGFGFETAEGENANPTVILCTMHRFSWDFEKITIGASGLQMLSRLNNYFQLADMFPVFSWHNGDIEQNNMRLLADFSWIVFPGLVLNGVGGLDDISTEILGVKDSVIPTIPAYVIGLSYFPFLNGNTVSLHAETGYTHYLWGNYDGSATMNLDPNPLSRSIFRYLRDGGSVLLPITSPYGPGTVWVTGGADYTSNSARWRFGLDFSLISKNTMASLVGTPFKADESVANAPRTVFFSLQPAVEYSTRSFVFSVAPNFLLQDGTLWSELDIAISYRYDKKMVISRH